MIIKLNLVNDFNLFVNEMCKFTVGLIRSCFNNSRFESRTRSDLDSNGSRFFKLILPISKLLRSILDRASRVPGLINLDSWHVDFPISDYNVLKRRDMLRNGSHFESIK